MDLEAVVRWQQGDGIVDFLVVKYRVRQRIQCASSTTRLGDFVKDISIMCGFRAVLGTSHLVSRLSPRCSHWDQLDARPPSLQPSCPRISVSAVSELLRALRIFPRPPPAPDLLLHDRPPFCPCCVERVAGTSAEVLVGHKKLKAKSVSSEIHSSFETSTSEYNLHISH
jgi:hypothetical protein